MDTRNKRLFLGGCSRQMYFQYEAFNLAKIILFYELFKS